MAASILGSLRSAASGGAVKHAESSGHVLKAILIVSLAFPMCAPGVFHALKRIGWIMKESPKFTMVQHVK